MDYQDYKKSSQIEIKDEDRPFRPYFWWEYTPTLGGV